MSAADGDPRAQRAEEIAAARATTPDAYVALLEKRLSVRPTVLDVALLEQTVAERPWADALRPIAARLLNYPVTPPETVILVNTFHRVPTAAAETVLIETLGLRRGSLHSSNAGGDMAFDRLTGIQEMRSRSLVRGHVPATVRVRAAIALLNVRPILIVRNIFDTIAPYAEDRTDPQMLAGYRRAALEPATRRRILVLRMASHLVDFYATWAAEQAAGRRVVHRWEDVKEDWAGFLVDRLAEHGRSVDRDAVARRLASLPADAHSGPGRGDMFSDEDRLLVRTLYLQYPGVDFRPIDAEAPAPRA